MLIPLVFCYSGCFLELSEIYSSCTCSSGWPGTLTQTFIRLFACHPPTHTHTHASCVLHSSLLGHREIRAGRRQTRLKDGADERGFKEQRKEGEGETWGGAESNLQVRLVGLVPVSLRCPLLYLSTCSSSPLLLFLSFPRRLQSVMAFQCV